MIKRSDILFIAGVLLLFLPFFMSEELYSFYTHLNHIHGFLMAFIKFAILATLGEVIGLRIKTGKYTQPGFGFLPRAVVWGFLGISITFLMPPDFKVLFAALTVIVLVVILALANMKKLKTQTA